MESMLSATPKGVTYQSCKLRSLYNQPANKKPIKRLKLPLSVPIGVFLLFILLLSGHKAYHARFKFVCCFENITDFIPRYKTHINQLTNGVARFLGPTCLHSTYKVPFLARTFHQFCDQSFLHLEN